jgi:hypothetical protein
MFSKNFLANSNGNEWDTGVIRGSEKESWRVILRI